MRESWEIIEECPDYAVSDFGRVEDTERRRLVPIRENAQGLAMVTIRNCEFKQCTRSVALLVARAFVRNPNVRAFDSIIYLNGDKTDCRAMNLMWRSRPFALRYHAMFNEQPRRLSVRIPATGEYFYSLRELCTTYGLIESITLNNMINNQSCFPYGWTIEEVTE